MLQTFEHSKILMSSMHIVLFFFYSVFPKYFDGLRTSVTTQICICNNVDLPKEVFHISSTKCEKSCLWIPPRPNMNIIFTILLLQIRETKFTIQYICWRIPLNTLWNIILLSVDFETITPPVLKTLTIRDLIQHQSIRYLQIQDECWKKSIRTKVVTIK